LHEALPGHQREILARVKAHCLSIFSHHSAVLHDRDTTCCMEAAFQALQRVVRKSAIALLDSLQNISVHIVFGSAVTPTNVYSYVQAMILDKRT